MAQRKIIIEELEALNSLKDLAESYEEIAAIELQRIKNSVLATRDYLAELSDVFVDLKSSYNREVKDLLTRLKAGDKTLIRGLQKNGKTLLVYLASNGRLYGAVTEKTYRLFIEDLKKEENKNAEIIIIGSAGKETYDNSGQKRPYTYFDLPDQRIKMDHLRDLVKKFLPYDKVYIYYGKFDNVVKQNPISTSITGEAIFEAETPETVPREDRFIFEPTLEKIFEFFETQIMTNLFSQTLLENQLARHASRVNAMEQALLHIETEEKILNKEKIRLKRLLMGKKQLETIAGQALWS